MKLKAKATASKFDRPDPLEPGTYPVRLVQVIDLGLQAQRPYKGKEKDPVNMIRVTYEFLDEFMKDEDGEDILDKPRWISEDFPFYPLTSDMATATKRYLALDPEVKYDGDWAAIIGNPAMATVVNNPGKGDKKDIVYENIAGLSAMRAKEAEKAPDLVNPPKVFSTDEPDLDVFFSLPEWIQDKIRENLEFEGSVLESALEAHKDGPKGGDKEKASKASQEGAELVSEGAEDEDDW